MEAEIDLSVGTVGDAYPSYAQGNAESFRQRAAASNKRALADAAW